MGYEVLHGIVDCLWIIGEPISVFKEAVEKGQVNQIQVDFALWLSIMMKTKCIIHMKKIACLSPKWRQEEGKKAL
jgi:hypothetical protein